MTKEKLNNYDSRLLTAMMSDMQSKDSVYRPGPYWAPKTELAAQSIQENGYKNFRSAYSTIGASFADNPQTYYATQLSPKRKAIYNALKSVPVVRDIINGQARMTSLAYQSFQRHQQHIADTSDTAARLAQAYDLRNSSAFGSENEVVVKGQSIPAHYLELCQQLDIVRQHINLEKINSVMEIGGGFGAIAHILLQNFPQIKTYVYLDIPPNLFIGTQYLRNLYPEAVRDYTDLQGHEEIHIESDRNDGGPVIYCICPWQIERLRGTVDLFYNSHSFVEMSKDIVANYARFIKNVSGPGTQYALVTYDGADDQSLPAENLTEFFPYASFENFRQPKLLEPWRDNIYSIGKSTL